MLSYDSVHGKADLHLVSRDYDHLLALGPFPVYIETFPEPDVGHHLAPDVYEVAAVCLVDLY